MDREKKTEDFHARLSESEKKIILQACALSGATYTTKARELLVTWARETIRENEGVVS